MGLAILVMYLLAAMHQPAQPAAQPALTPSLYSGPRVTNFGTGGPVGKSPRSAPHHH